MAEDKSGVLIRIPIDKKLEFEDMNPWHGSLSQFFLQALDEYLTLAKGQKTPAQLTQEAVGIVFRRDY